MVCYTGFSTSTNIGGGAAIPHYGAAAAEEGGKSPGRAAGFGPRGGRAFSAVLEVRQALDLFKSLTHLLAVELAGDGTADLITQMVTGGGGEGDGHLEERLPPHALGKGCGAIDQGAVAVPVPEGF